jgi:DNA-binding NarL/FixJ family response regulator
MALENAVARLHSAPPIARRVSGLSGGESGGVQTKLADFVTHLDLLTAGERAAAELIVTGATTKQIAERFDVTLQAIDARRARILKKMQVEGVVQLVRLWVEWELTRPIPVMQPE